MQTLKHDGALRVTYGRAVAVLLLIHLAMLGWIAAWNAPVCDEVGHLTAGLYEWKFGHFFMYRVNPPLVKLVAAIPAALGNPKTDWSQASDGPGVRTEFEMGQDFLRANRPNGAWYFTAGRLLCLPFTVLGGWMCYLWGRSLYGERSGFMACLLWCMSPVVLGWGSTFTPDAAAASLGLVAAYAFRGWLRNPTWKSAYWSGLAWGVCELSKMTWIVLFPLWPFLWLGWRLTQSQRTTSLKSDFMQWLMQLGICLFVMNVGYGFEGVFRSLGSYDFVSQSLTGHETTGTVGNRFRETLLARCPIPLPYNYVRGIDLQKVDFEKGMESYLWGTWSDRGWWYYYPVASCLKLPLGMLVLLVVALASHFIPRCRLSFTRDELLLLIPSIVVFVLVCSQTGFGRYIRYVLPSLPAGFVLISKLWNRDWPRWVSRTYIGLLFWSIASSVWVYPYSLAYFNELAGGPLGGHRYLLDANIDWGQDLIRLKHWIARHPEATPIYCIQTGFVSPNEIGIDCQWPMKMAPPNDEQQDDIIPDPGWYAVSVHELFQRHGQYRYLLKYRPVDRVGYSMWIYHITKETRPLVTGTSTAGVRE